jgi:hypothetical protein
MLDVFRQLLVKQRVVSWSAWPGKVTLGSAV